ncbi:MAG: PilN domain-containing protein [Proteobacteria bacterium]|nr:PilN domain-containing protein [Pseudomonadota bacterium]
MIDARGSAGQAQLAKRLTELEGPVVVVLPDDLAMRSDLTLPDTARRSLDQVLDVEIERLTPFKSTDVALTREIHAAAGGQIRVELTIVPRARIEALIAPLRAAGITIDHVVADHASIERATDRSLIGPPTGPSKRRGSGIPALATIALAAIAIVSPFLEQERRIEGLDAQRDMQRPRVEAVMRLARQVEQLEARDARLRDFAENRAAMTLLLEETTRVLPDDTWLVQYQYGAETLTLEGRSAAATALIDVLTASPWFNDVRFRAPVNRDPISGADRFRLSAKVSPR